MGPFLDRLLASDLVLHNYQIPAGVSEGFPPSPPHNTLTPSPMATGRHCTFALSADHGQGVTVFPGPKPGHLRQP